MDRTSKFAGVFLFLFALPFAGGGLFAFLTAISHLINGTAEPNEWVLLVIGVLFTGVGGGLMFVAVYGSKLLKRQERAQAEHPSEPWLWREDWPSDGSQARRVPA